MRLILCHLLLASSLYAKTEYKTFDPKSTPKPPDYSKSHCWAALPDKKDYADLVPKECNVKDAQQSSAADVFFIYPTIFTKKPTGNNLWNADVYDSILNKEIDRSSIKYQSTIFNAAGRVYAPRYRQAHLRSYFTSDKESAKKAFEVAYADIKAAFEYYLANYNKGRPIVIAGHSQGTHHALRLLKEYFDNNPLSKQLVAAYLIGGDVHTNDFEILQPCADSNATGCYVSWRTYSNNFVPRNNTSGDNPLLCTNPLTWKNDTSYAPRELNIGGVLKNFDKVVTHVCDARVDEKGLLRINKPHVQGRIFIRYKNYHKADYNLFYMNVRTNVINRIKAYQKKY